MTRRPAKPPATPTERNLHEAALAHLARYGGTRTGLLRVLDRRIARWAAATPGVDAAEARTTARGVVARLVESGAVNDAAYAESRTRSLRRAGKSARAIGAHLAAKGVAASFTKDQAVADPDQELAAAAIHMRRRRLGPFRVGASVPDQVRRDLGALARAGFAHDVARRALRLDAEAAEALISAFRAGL